MCVATYADNGLVTVTDDDTEIYVGEHDADGAEWAGPVDQMLAKAGFARTGAWDGDNAPVTRA